MFLGGKQNIQPGTFLFSDNFYSIFRIKNILSKTITLTITGMFEWLKNVKGNV